MGAHAPGTERLLGSGDDGRSGWDVVKGFLWRILPGVLGALLALAIMLPLLYYPYLWSADNGKYPEYSVAVAGFSGLDPDADLLPPSRATLDPTFDLTLRIKEPRKYSAACVPGGTATVSYRGAQLARGPVQGFCGRSEGTAERGSVMAWGNAVVVPRFARGLLADELRRWEAVLDVALTTPPRYCQYCYQTVIECRPRLGGGEASPPCWVRTQYPTLPDDARTPVRRMLRFFGSKQ